MRQGHLQDRTRRGVGDLDQAAVQLGDPARDRQAEPGAAVVRRAGGEALEDGLAVGDRDARPLVRDLQPDVVADACRGDRHLTTAGAVARGVVEQVGEQLVQPLRVSRHGEVGRLHPHAVAQPVDPGLRHRVGEELGDVDLLDQQRGHALLDAGQVEQVGHQTAQSLRLGQGDLQRFRVGAGHAVDEVLEDRLQRRDRCAQLVRDVRHEVTALAVDHLEGGGHPVERSRQLAHLVRGRGGDPS